MKGHGGTCFYCPTPAAQGRVQPPTQQWETQTVFMISLCTYIKMPVGIYVQLGVTQIQVAIKLFLQFNLILRQFPLCLWKYSKNTKKKKNLKTSKKFSTSPHIKEKWTNSSNYSQDETHKKAHLPTFFQCISLFFFTFFCGFFILRRDIH